MQEWHHSGMAKSFSGARKKALPLGELAVNAVWEGYLIDSTMRMASSRGRVVFR